MRNLLPFTALVLATFAVGEFTVGTADTRHENKPQNRSFSAQQLLEKVVDNELAADKNDNYLWKYTSVMRTSGQDTSEEIVETRHGILTLKLVENGKHVSKEEEKQQRDHIRYLVAHPDEAIKAEQDQSQDADKAEQMLRLLPQALLAKYGSKRGGLQALDVRPNPDFHPSSHEAEVFQAMSGMIWVDTKEDRLEEIDGHLSHEVEFGWGGVLGHLDKGGRFHVVQKEVVPGHWEIIRLYVDMQGKALFFKSISVHQDETRSDYKLLPPNTTLADGAKLLTDRS
ncbi:MAG TPA: hypothetical protein VJN69_01215 [Candidatus Acidoferrales bacterium]|nr:hypothetical protein [Candidatus Acidoferrales bacterium]